MARKLVKFKNRKVDGTFSIIPHHVMDSPNWINASGNAIKLLMVLARACNNKNNGDLSAAFSQMRRRGWASPSTLDWALKELLHYRLIVKTRQGDLTKKPCLYALTWHPIDELGSKLELCKSSNVASGIWKQEMPIFDRKLVAIARPKRKK